MKEIYTQLMQKELRGQSNWFPVYLYINQELYPIWKKIRTLSINFVVIQKLDASKMPKDVHAKAVEASNTFHRWATMVYSENAILTMKRIASSSFSGFSSENASTIAYMIANLSNHPAFYDVTRLNSNLDSLMRVTDGIYNRAEMIINNRAQIPLPWRAIHKDFKDLSNGMAGIEALLQAYSSVQGPVATWLKNNTN